MKNFLIILITGLFLLSCQDDNYNNNINDSPSEEPATQVYFHNAVKDRDGNYYDAVRIGNQIWMTSNLKTTHYADGLDIPLGNVDISDWVRPYRYALEDNIFLVSQYGYLYNWPAVMKGKTNNYMNNSRVQGICPNGWHVPSFSEWTELKDYVQNNENYILASGNVAKALASASGWTNCDYEGTVGNNQNINNSTKFSALPAGDFVCGLGHSFSTAGTTTSFWTSTCTTDDGYAARAVKIYYNGSQLSLDYSYAGYNGFYVRCIRN